MKILLIGSNGQLGYDFQELFKNLNIEYIAADYEELNIANDTDIENFFRKNNNFTHIINCAAYNDVDKAENDTEQCIKINEEAPLTITRYAKNMGAVFITYSSDFVFDGRKKNPYLEEDIISPLSVYGKSKSNMEEKILNEYEKIFVIRTSWLFGINGENFNTQVINWSKNRDTLNIVDDQISAPTYSKDLAEFSWKLIQTGQFGLYHITNNGTTSKYEQAKYVLEKIGWKGELGTAKTEDFNLPAKRPHFSKLSSEKVEKLLEEKIPNWQNGIDRFLEEIRIIKK